MEVIKMFNNDIREELSKLKNRVLDLECEIMNMKINNNIKKLPKKTKCDKITGKVPESHQSYYY
jgi:hypothetical protein